MRAQLKIIAGNTGWMMMDRLVRMLLGVTVGAWIARHLGPERYGALAYVIAFLALFQTASALGLDMILARELASNRKDSGRLLGTSACLRFGTGLLAWAAACASMAVIRPGDAEALLLTALIGATLVLQPADLIDLWFQSQSQNKRAVAPRMLSFLLVSILRVVLIGLDSPLWGFATAYILESALALTFLLISYRHSSAASVWTWDTSTARNLLNNSWPLLISGLSIIVYMRIDQILLRNLASERELGLYSAILPFSQAWHFIPAALCASVTPILVKLQLEDPITFERRVQDLFALLTWSSLAVCFAMVLSAGSIVRILLGAKYQGAEIILAIHVFSNIPVFLGLAQSRYLTIIGNTRIILIQTAIGMIASIALNLTLIPRYGAYGAALSSVLANLASAVFSNAALAPKLFIMQISAWTRRYTKRYQASH